MDPNKSSSPPATGWSTEKSSEGMAPAPPPYQDHPAPPQPGPGYPPQGYGYNQYGNPGYGQQPYPGGQQPYPGGQQLYPGGQQPYPAQIGAITVQPTVYVAQGPLAHPVNDYLCYSVFTMLCCCLPLGIAALIYSISTREANYSGNQAAAERSSKMARILNHVGLGIGIGVTILFIVYFIVMVSVTSN